jgi:cytochrome c-type biogenesis protein CcmF
MNLFIGQLGHLLVIISFVTSLLAAIAYWFSTTRKELSPEKESWRKIARGAFWVHTLAVVGVVISLFYIIYNHLYEYHYAWSHSSRNLPTHFMISCFWEGQEGSFLLWIFWHALLGITLMYTNKTWEAPVMSIFSLVQAFLASMILGVMFFGTKVGSSPFILLRDAMDAPIFSLNPEYIPEDGTGLNPLLQNYWMVIHPPTLFLGFAFTLVPFAYAMAGLWQNRFKEWIRPALPWTIGAGFVLGIGILMGAYWAYETLNFGGYWNWDPVENAVYIPWLILIGAIHTMITYKKSGLALKASYILVITTFVLILYSTFLTRSGILGDSSVHSFTDLGLSGQLLAYLLVFAALSVLLLVIRWKKIPSTDREISTYSREFWIFIGVSVLCLAAFQVLIPTSIPVYNAIVNSLGGNSNAAPPADQVEYYTKWQLWFAVGIAILSGVGQFFWWKKMDKKAFFNAISTPAMVSLLISSVVIVFTGVDNLIYIVLLTASIFSITANGTILISLLKSNFKLSGGAVAHIGMAMMLLGILFSSGYSNVISINNSGLIYRNEFSDEMNRDNVLLWRGTSQKMKEYELTYRGPRLEAKNFPEYIKKEDLALTADPHTAIARKDILYKGQVFFHEGDNVSIYPENTYYEVEYKRPDGSTFTLFPRGQVNPTMGLLASPDIKHAWGHDLYTHISSIPGPDEERQWSETEEFTVALGDTFIVNDYIAELVNVERVFKIENVNLGPQDAAIMASIRILGTQENYVVQPKFVIKDQLVGKPSETLEDLGLKITFQNIDPENGKFTFGVNTTQKDWIILKAMEKPLINVLWIGTLVLSLGFGMAIVRRYKDFRLMRDKDLE